MNIEIGLTASCSQDWKSVALSGRYRAAGIFEGRLVYEKASPDADGLWWTFRFDSSTQRSLFQFSSSHIDVGKFSNEKGYESNDAVTYEKCSYDIRKITSLDTISDKNQNFPTLSRQIRRKPNHTTNTNTNTKTESQWSRAEMAAQGKDWGSFGIAFAEYLESVRANDIADRANEIAELELLETQKANDIAAREL